MKTEIITKASRLVNKAGFQIKKHSPEILMVAGIAGTITSTVMACKSTMKIDDILDETKKKKDIIHDSMEKGNVNNVEYTQQDGKKDLTFLYTQTGVKLFKLYAPAIGVGVLSIASIVAGHKILKKRNIALAAAYTVVDKGFKNYRKNVVERFGEEIDRELRYNIKAKEVEVETTDENGNKIVKKENINTIENPTNRISDYSRLFDATSRAHKKDPYYNMTFLKQQQNYANEILRSRGYLFLNEVYEMLDIPKAPYGQVIGWIYDEKNPKGDNYVDFGIYDNIDEAKGRFINGLEYNVLLDFNVDGNIYEDFMYYSKEH